MRNHLQSPQRSTWHPYILECQVLGAAETTLSGGGSGARREVGVSWGAGGALPCPTTATMRVSENAWQGRLH